MKTTLYFSIFSFVLLTLFSCASGSKITTVPLVDLDRYAGKWYEIASYPQRFQKDCFGTTAIYTATDKGFVVVENQCNKGSFTGSSTGIKGKAFVVPNTGNAKLKVQFFWPFKGKYWIIDLADDYSYAVVSHPNQKSLWILSRTPQMDEQVLDAILVKLKTLDFDLDKLKRTPQKKELDGN